MTTIVINEGLKVTLGKDNFVQIDSVSSSIGVYSHNIQPLINALIKFLPKQEIEHPNFGGC